MDLICVTSSIRRLACHWWNRYSGSLSELRYFGNQYCPRMARLNIRHECYTIDGARMNAEPNDPARVLIHDHQDPMGVADSHRNRSMLQRLSFMWPRKVSQEGPPESWPGRW